MLKTVTTKIYTCDLCKTENIKPVESFAQIIGYSGLDYIKMVFNVELSIPYSSNTHVCQRCVLETLKKYIDNEEIPF